MLRADRKRYRTTLWLRKKGAAHSATFQNIYDASILWFLREPHQVDATVVRQATIAQISTTERESIERVREHLEGSPHWVLVVYEAKWHKFVNLERITDAVLEDDSRGPPRTLCSYTREQVADPF